MDPSLNPLKSWNGETRRYPATGQADDGQARRRHDRGKKEQSRGLRVASGSGRLNDQERRPRLTGRRKLHLSPVKADGSVVQVVSAPRSFGDTSDRAEAGTVVATPPGQQVHAEARLSFLTKCAILLIKFRTVCCPPWGQKATSLEPSSPNVQKGDIGFA